MGSRHTPEDQRTCSIEGDEVKGCEDGVAGIYPIRDAFPVVEAGERRHCVTHFSASSLQNNQPHLFLYLGNIISQRLCLSD